MDDLKVLTRLIFSLSVIFANIKKGGKAEIPAKQTGLRQVTELRVQKDVSKVII